MKTTDSYYEDLEAFTDFAQFTDLAHYRLLPDDWLVVITDIQGSTIAIQEGRYKDVNSLGAASIVAMLNAVKPLKLPYVFGGDGATLCIPPSQKDAVAAALVATREMAAKEFSLQLRIGMVAVSVIIHAKKHIQIGKYKPSAYFQQAMFQGDGLAYAESLVKDPGPENAYLIDHENISANANFDGFECRWNEIPSPHEETVALLVQVVAAECDRESIYKEIAQKILDIYGAEDEHHPLRTETLRLTHSARKLSAEIRVRTAFVGSIRRWLYTYTLKMMTFLGRYLMHQKKTLGHVDWGGYKQMLIANTDYRKFDEVLRMVISGSQEQRARLVAYLEPLTQQKKIVFGVHASSAALITCLINNHDTDHVHFLDAADGGYAMAAKGMKRQLQEL